MPAKKAAGAGHVRGKSGLAAPKPGQPLSLINVLRETRGLLTPNDVAPLLRCTPKHVRTLMNKGVIPEADLGNTGLRLIDPATWVRQLEGKNPHLVAAAGIYRAA